MNAVAEPVGARRGLIRFLLVGGTAALAYALVTAALVGRVGLPAAVTSALVWIAFIPPVYWCHKVYTFRGHPPRRGALGLYALVQGVSVAIVSTAGALFVTGAMGPDTAVYLAANAVAAGASYALNRLVVFGNEKGRPKAAP